MKKVFVLILGLMVLGACALQDVRVESNVFSTQRYSFDEIWAASIQASVSQGYRVVNLEKEAGVLIFAKEKNIFTQNEAPQLNVIISEVGDNYQVTAQYTQPGQITDIWGTGRKAVKGYITEVYTILNRR